MQDDIFIFGKWRTIRGSFLCSVMCCMDLRSIRTVGTRAQVLQFGIPDPFGLLQRH